MVQGVVTERSLPMFVEAVVGYLAAWSVEVIARPAAS